MSGRATIRNLGMLAPFQRDSGAKICGSRPPALAGGDIDAIFLDGKTVVGQDADSWRLFGAPLEASRDAIAQAFRAHGYRWIERDPFLDQYRPWRPGGDGLPAEVNAVLRAREAALRKYSITELRDLTQALQRLGYAVREEGTRQHWRRLPDEQASRRSGPTAG